MPARKYEEHGGPTLADMKRIADQNVRDRMAARTALGEFVAFNYVAGAPDGHSKNISFLLLPGQIEVAPLYDLASSLPYADSGRRLSTVAVSIDGRRKFGQVLGKHWDSTAHVLGVDAFGYRDRVRELAEGFPDAFSDALAAVESPSAEAIRQNSMDRIGAHIKRIVECLDDPVERPRE